METRTNDQPLSTDLPFSTTAAKLVVRKEQNLFTGGRKDKGSTNKKEQKQGSADPERTYLEQKDPK